MCQKFLGYTSIRRRPLTEHPDDTGVVLGAQARLFPCQIQFQRCGGQRGLEAALLGGVAYETHILNEDVQGALWGYKGLFEHPLAAVLEHEGVCGAVPDRLEDEARCQTQSLG